MKYIISCVFSFFLFSVFSGGYVYADKTTASMEKDCESVEDYLCHCPLKDQSDRYRICKKYISSKFEDRELQILFIRSRIAKSIDSSGSNRAYMNVFYVLSIILPVALGGWYSFSQIKNRGEKSKLVLIPLTLVMITALVGAFKWDKLWGSSLH